jgi:hypothetical protein
MKKMLTLCAPIVTLAVLAIAPAAAQAQSPAAWYVGSHRLPVGQTAPVELEGETSIYIESFVFRVTCHAKGSGTVENGEDTATSSFTELRFNQCAAEEGGSEKLGVKVCPPRTKPELIARELPLDGQLDEFEYDVMGNVDLELACSGLSGETLTGTIFGLANPGKLQFGYELDSPVNFLAPGALFTGVWRLLDPEGGRRISAIASPEA